MRGGCTYLWRRCRGLYHLWGAPLSPGQTWATVPRPAPTGPTAEEQEITPSACHYHQINQKYDIFCFCEKKRLSTDHILVTLWDLSCFSLYTGAVLIKIQPMARLSLSYCEEAPDAHCLFFCIRSKQTSARNVNASPPEWQIWTCWGSKRGRSVPDALKKKPVKTPPDKNNPHYVLFHVTNKFNVICSLIM